MGDERVNFSGLKNYQRWGFFNKVENKVDEKKITDEQFQAIHCSFFYSFQELDDCMNQETGNIYQEKLDKLKKVRGQSFVGLRTYNEAAGLLRFSGWEEASSIIDASIRRHEYSLQTLAPELQTSKLESLLSELSKPPFSGAIKTINAENWLYQLQNDHYQYKEFQKKCDEMEEAKPEMSGTEASEKTYECFKNLFIFIQAKTITPGEDSVYKELKKSIDEIIKEYNAKAKANRTRNENKKEDDDNNGDTELDNENLSDQD